MSIIIATALGDKKTPDGGLKRAELLMKYKTLQKQNREASCSKTNKSLKSKSTRNPIFLKVFNSYILAICDNAKLK